MAANLLALIRQAKRQLWGVNGRCSIQLEKALQTSARHDCGSGSNCVAALPQVSQYYRCCIGRKWR
jgi:hypothetical protein